MHDLKSHLFLFLQLRQKATQNKFVETIDLPTKDKNIRAHKECSVAGWGRIQPTKDSPFSDVLRVAEEQIQFNFECKNIYKDYFNSEHMICTKFNKRGGSMCQVIKQFNIVIIQYCVVQVLQCGVCFFVPTG